MPGLFGIQANSTPFIIFQIICFSVLLLYVVTYLVRQWPRISLYKTEARFAWVYTGLLIITGLNVTMLATQDGEPFTSLAQFFLPAILASTLIVGFGRTAFQKQDIERFLQIILALTVVSSFYNIVINLQDLISIASISNSYDLDLKGFYYNRNVFGYMMATGVACGFYLWLQQKRPVYLLAVTVLITSLLATMSRGAIIFTLIFCIIFFLSQRKSKLISSLVVAALFIPAAVAIINQPFIQDNFIRAENADTGRSELREFGIDYTTQHNLLLGDGQRAIKALEKEHGYSSYHNLYIEALATQGILGVTIILLGVGYAFSRIRIIIKRYNDLGFFFLAYLLAYVVYILIEALPLFYATPNSLVATYIIILLPLFTVNSFKQKDTAT